MGLLCPQDKRYYVFIVPGMLFLFVLLAYIFFSGASLFMLTIDFFFAVLHMDCMVSEF